MRDWDSDKEREKEVVKTLNKLVCTIALFPLGTSRVDPEQKKKRFSPPPPSQRSIEATRLQCSLNKCQPNEEKAWLPWPEVHAIVTPIQVQHKSQVQKKSSMCQWGRMPLFYVWGWHTAQKWVEISLGISKLASLARSIYTTQHLYTLRKGALNERRWRWVALGSIMSSWDWASRKRWVRS